VLLIEDDQVDQMAFKRLVKRENLAYDYAIAGSVAEAEKILKSTKFDLIITDYSLGDSDAFDLFDLIVDTPVIFVTGLGDEAVAVKAMKAGAADYLIKDPERNYLQILPTTIDNAIKHQRLELELRKRDLLLRGVATAMNRLLTTSDHTTAINEALAVIGEAAAVDRVYIFENHPHPDTGEKAYSQRFEWARERVQPQIDNPTLQNLLWGTFGLMSLYETLAAGGSLHGPVRNFPPAAWKFFESQDIQSLLAMPIFIDDHFWGLIGFDDCHAERHWSKNEESILVALAAGIGGALKRRQTEESLRQSEGRFRQLAENIHEIVWMKDRRMTETIYISPAYEEITGRSCESVYQQPDSWLEAVYAEDRERIQAALEKQLNGEAIVEEYRIVRPDGSIRWIWDRSFPIHNELGEFYRIAGISEDITERKLLEDSLRQQTVELQAQNEELDAFAHTVAHDLQTPLGPTIGFASLLKEEYMTLSADEIRDIAQAIARNGRKMSNIINELLLLAGVRKMKIEPKPLDMAAIVAEALQRLASLIEEHQAEIILPAASAWPVALGYGPWIEEVWINYISNAIKYGGRPPRLELGATVYQTSEGSEISEISPSRVRFWVRDNGPGLTSEEQAQLFTQFTRLHQVQAKGHGLGLSIVRRIIKKLGGQVGVESQIGQGSIFNFTLPGLGSVNGSR
ncbi:MAG TPA: PAS domain-containing protein, partial [Anaerolineae bacterium]|nr:PAS domain-containing protein [Anaerolineae bacterium]